MSTTTESAPLAPVTNLRAAKRQQAAARKQSGTAKAPAKAPAKKAPTKKAPAKQAPTKAAPVKGGDSPVKLRWQFDSEKDDKGRAPAHAVAADGTVYRIVADGDKWTATVTRKGGKAIELAAKVAFGAAYAAITKHHKAA